MSIGEPFYSITQPEDAVEICIATEGRLDELININLQTQCVLCISAIMFFYIIIIILLYR